MEPGTAALLRCPVCARRLRAAPAAGRGLDCPAGHHFDQARQGYVDLVSGAVTHEGDSAAMVEARARFLAAGHFDAVGTLLADCAERALRYAPHVVVDAGAGTGHYLARVLEKYPDALGLALDVAKPALRRAARAHPRALAVRADVWRGLPVADGVAGVLLNVFAPRNAAEFARVLHPDGTLLVVTPAAGHLGELVDALGLLTVDPEKDRRLEQTLGGRFELAAHQDLNQPLRLSHEEALSLVEMGPSAWHTDPVRLAARLAALPTPVETVARLRVSTYQLR
jgi:23S rRNA (guanine745-N1)-methyltransferase